MIAVGGAPPPAHREHFEALGIAWGDPEGRAALNRAVSDTVIVIFTRPDERVTVMCMPVADFAQDWLAMVEPHVQGKVASLVQSPPKKPGYRWLVSLLPDDVWVASFRAQRLAAGGDA